MEGGTISFRCQEDGELHICVVYDVASRMKGVDLKRSVFIICSQIHPFSPSFTLNYSAATGSFFWVESMPTESTLHNLVHDPPYCSRPCSATTKRNGKGEEEEEEGDKNRRKIEMERSFFDLIWSTWPVTQALFWSGLPFWFMLHVLQLVCKNFKIKKSFVFQFDTYWSYRIWRFCWKFA